MQNQTIQKKLVTLVALVCLSYCSTCLSQTFPGETGKDGSGSSSDGSAATGGIRGKIDPNLGDRLKGPGHGFDPHGNGDSAAMPASTPNAFGNKKDNNASGFSHQHLKKNDSSPKEEGDYTNSLPRGSTP